MVEIPVFRVRTERMVRDRFAAIGAHLGVHGDVVATDEALFVGDRERALAFAQPGSRFAGLLLFTDQSQALAPTGERPPSVDQAQEWAREFTDRFALGPGHPREDGVRVGFRIRAVSPPAAVERGRDGGDVRLAPVTAAIVCDVQVNDVPVTGPRGTLRMTFGAERTPVLVHRAFWETLETFETRTLLTEEDVRVRLADRLARRGSAKSTWNLLGLRLVYFAGEANGGPDLLAPYYFAEIEMGPPGDRERIRQGPRQLVQIPAAA